MESLARISASRKTGAEPFTAAGWPAGATVADFWGWSRSDLLDNTERRVLAEFIVASALGIPTDGVRESWAAWDLATPGGVRVEVKSAAYLQSWAQKELSKISFSTPGLPCGVLSRGPRPASPRARRPLRRGWPRPRD